MKKTVLITGASGDIGIVIAGTLAAEGYQLILHYHKNLKAIEQFMERNDPSVLAIIKSDLSSNNQLRSFLDQLVFSVDAIIFASGSGPYGLFQDTKEAEMDSLIHLHVKAPWLITKHLLPGMIQRKSGKIIFITSIWANVGASHEVIYSSVKGAQNSFVKALAKEVAPSGISVNAISPGFIDTKMNNHLTPLEKQAIIGNIPANRAGTPMDIAHVVGFLLDEKSAYIQGEVIEINGGW